MNDVPAPTTRVREGRWLGGVCAGLAARWGAPVARVRLGFVLAAAAGYEDAGGSDEGEEKRWKAVAGEH